MIQFRMLNRSKGPAMWSPRCQSDRMLFAQLWRQTLEQNPNIDFWQEMVSGLLIEDGTVKGVVTSLGIEIPAKTVVLTNGTFLNGKIHIGEKNFGGGRAGERSAKGITEQLVQAGFEAGRMKTGTPPRLDGRSLDYTRMEEQLGDENPSKFSYTDTAPLTKQRSCWITYTNESVHEILRTGFEKSPMFTGRIQGIGPRYCPSVEDKINRFADKDRHQIFVEPEGWDTVEVYVNGFSTSLPEDIQYKALQKIPGFENAKMFRPGYAIEYDYFPPTQLTSTLETIPVKNLFFAGQINGTTGYEEAACQGLMAGINAHQNAHELMPFTLQRSEAYIGVLIDDLINKGTEEPYRMFTSRAEYRTLLRQDNADIRLTKKGAELGLASKDRLNNLEKKTHESKQIIETIRTTKVAPDVVNPILENLGLSPIRERTPLEQLLKRPQLSIKDLRAFDESFDQAVANVSVDASEHAEIEIKYASYIEKENILVSKMRRMEDHVIPDFFNYASIPALSIEAKQKLTDLRPTTIGQASRISGVSPADISVLIIHLGR
jgi:tRNA uridine 5-carboxymethylaminomethyl modification enzyme